MMTMSQPMLNISTICRLYWVNALAFHTHAANRCLSCSLWFDVQNSKYLPPPMLRVVGRLEKYQRESLDLKITKPKFSHPFSLPQVSFKVKHRACIWKSCQLYPAVVHVPKFQLCVILFWHVCCLLVLTGTYWFLKHACGSTPTLPVH